LSQQQSAARLGSRSSPARQLTTRTSPTYSRHTVSLLDALKAALAHHPGGFPKFISQGHNDAYLPVFLQEEGYNTYYTGKLFNAHTVDNYDKPYPRGWTGHDFLLDPWTYVYLNATFQRNQDEPVSYDGEYTTDVLAGKALGFLDEALAQPDKPFFLGIAPVAPHSNINLTGLYDDGDFDPSDESQTRAAINFNLPDLSHGLGATPPIPAARHAHLFPDAKVPRTANFNPEDPTGASWIRAQPRQSPENVAYNDVFYRARLQALQAVDELVDAVVRRLEQDERAAANTYIVYTTDNGYHIGQHRLQPGKECGYETDVNIPLIVRGPGVPRGREVSGAVATTHADLAPTLLHLAGAAPRHEFDGAPIPLTEDSLQAAEAEVPGAWHEHVTVEFWGQAASEGLWGFLDNNTFIVPNNTYKSIRVVSRDYDLYYSVWCNNEKELYDLSVSLFLSSLESYSRSSRSTPIRFTTCSRRPSPPPPLPRSQLTSSFPVSTPCCW
jgi:arylsulfatase A-like enzyme